MATKFRRVYNASNFTGIATADVVCPAYQWTAVGKLTVPAQQAVAWGATDIINGGQTGSAIYLRFDEDVGAGTQIHGVVRFAVSNATETDIKVIAEERTERLSASTTYDRGIAVLLPESKIFAKQDSKLIIYFYPDGASSKTIDYNGTNTKIVAPVTILQ